MGSSASLSPPADGCPGLRAAYVATRSLLGTRDALVAQRVVVALCHALGAQVAPAEAEVPDSVPLDISLGVGAPLLPVTGDPRVRALLVRYLAPAVLDARAVVEGARIAERLLQMATVDVLTGVWGRQSLMFAVNHARPGDCVALLDIDHFKTVNDTLGHDAGDATLVDFAAHLRGAVRDRDIVGRLGGDEFVVLFQATALEDACAVLNRLRASWSGSLFLPVTFSSGVASVIESASDPEQAGQIAMRAADELMYDAKAAGRDRVECRPSNPPHVRSAGDRI